MMLNHIADERNDPSCKQAADKIKNAYNQALSDNQKTRDLGGDLGIDPFADAVIERLGG